MCSNCYSLDQLFNANKRNPRNNLVPTFYFLNEMMKQGRLLHFAGDCEFYETLQLVSEEKHYTYRQYIECTDCHQIYYLGICIRGTPIYKKIENINIENIDNLLWGREGFYFT